MPQKYVVFDFETTGFSPTKNEIIQIGAVKYDENDVEIARFNQLVKPQRSYISSEITKLTGISGRDVVDQPLIEAVLPDFLEFIKEHLLIAHNAPFDISFLYQAIIDCGISGVESFKVYDTLVESKKLLKARSYALSNLKDFLGMSDLRSHDALNDCLITAKLYQHLQELSRPKPVIPIVEDIQLDLFAEFDAIDGEITEELRRKLGLPITKSLVYYRQDELRRWETFDLTGISVNQEYSSGFSLTVSLHTAEKVVIHSDFLKEMQKANFVKTMESEA